MKKVLLILVVLVMVGSGWYGCYREAGYANPKTGETLAPAGYAALSEEQKLDWQAAVLEGIDPKILAKIEPVTKVVADVGAAAKPWVPEPFRLILELAGVLLLLWEENKRRKTATLLDKISLGAKLTAKTVDKLVRPMTDLWGVFKDNQNDAKKNTDAIMPDDV